MFHDKLIIRTPSLPFSDTLSEDFLKQFPSAAASQASTFSFPEVNGTKSNRIDELVKGLKEVKDSGPFRSGLVDVVKDTPRANDLFSCVDGKIHNLYQNIQEGFFHPDEDLPLSLFTNKVSGNKELQEALNDGNYDSLPDLSRKYFYTPAGVKSGMLAGYRLLQEGQPLLALAHLKSALKKSEAIVKQAGKYRENVEFSNLKGINEEISMLLEIADRQLGTVPSEKGSKFPKCVLAQDKSAALGKFVGLSRTAEGRAKVDSALLEDSEAIHTYLQKNTDPKNLIALLDESWLNYQLISDIEAKDFTAANSKDNVCLSPLQKVEHWFGQDLKNKLFADEIVKNPVRFYSTLLASRNDRFVKVALRYLKDPKTKAAERAEDIVPYLAELLEDPGDAFQIAEELLSSLGENGVKILRQRLSSPDLAVRKYSVNALGKLKAASASALPELSRTLQDPDRDLRKRTVMAISQMGEKGKSAYPQLIKALNDENKDVRFQAIHAFMSTEALNPEVFEALRKSLGDKENDVVGAAAIALGSFREKAEPVIPEMISLLKSENDMVRGMAALALGQIGKKAEIAVPDLHRVLTTFSKDQMDFVFAGEALAIFSQKSLPLLIKDLDSKNAAIQKRAMEVLAKMYDRAEPAAPRLIELLLADEPTDALRALVNMGDKSVPHLKKALSDPNKKLRLEVLSTLGAMGPSAESAIPEIVNQIGDKNKEVRKASIKCLGAIDTKLKPAIPRLVEALSDEDSSVRLESVSTLSKIYHNNEVVVPALTKALSDKDGSVELNAIIALGRLKAESAVKPIMEKLSHGHPSMKWAAIESLGQIGEASHPAIPKLIDLLSDKLEGQTASRALAGIGEKAIQPLINVIADDESPSVTNAAFALSKMGVKAAVAIPALKKRIEKYPKSFQTGYLQQVVREIEEEVINANSGKK